MSAAGAGAVAVTVGAAVAVTDLSKSYGAVQALCGLSFSVNAGEIFGILGPNGSGKTTTIECILGTRARDSGAVRVLGLDPVTDRRAVFRRVGVQFQDSSWQPGIRVDELCRATACLYDPQPQWRRMLESFDLAKRARGGDTAAAPRHRAAERGGDGSSNRGDGAVGCGTRGDRGGRSRRVGPGVPVGYGVGCGAKVDARGLVWLSNNGGIDDN